MFKKLVAVVPVVVAVAFAFSGCAPTAAPAKKKDAINTIKYAESTAPAVITTPTLADLDVSETKVSGAAKGAFSGSANKATVRDRLEQSAIAQALQQKEGADVLIGVVFYYQETYIGQSRGEITVTAIGYPARYKNFRSLDPSEDGKDGGKAVSVTGSLKFGEKGSDGKAGGMIPSILQGGSSD